ncbi:hypothetical protein ACLOAU_02295 [Niabella sp. CJ426]|uniref:hypothetical protein n=1 Tax=Niabella sp. CJ426 TaxID=3393740 RepID=UPI003CFEFD65
MKKKLLKYIVIAGNVVILILASRWISRENLYEPLIVIVTQLLSLISLITDFTRNANFNNLTRGKYDITHTGAGDLNVTNQEDTEIKYDQK